MHVGVVFPQTEIGSDAGAIRDYARRVETAGYEFLSAYDHVLGADPERPGGFTGPYTHRTPFHEVFVLLSHLAAVTDTVELVTEVLVLPQRQTALVAKQAASLDVLSGGRARLGVGIGWNAVEYEALGTDFHNRGRRIEEQIAVMRSLWMDEVVTVEGRWHAITAAGINPLPVRRPIPVWMGGSAEPALRRAARIADGWMVNMRLGPRLESHLAAMRGFLHEYGRDAGKFGIAGRVHHTGDPAATVEDLLRFEQLGVSHCSVNTMGADLQTPEAHTAALEAVMAAWSEHQMHEARPVHHVEERL